MTTGPGKDRILKVALLLAMSITASCYGFAQDSTAAVRFKSTISGSVGVTTNGFSIIPSFSFNSPAIISQLYWRKNKFSIDPDIRFTPNGKKGSVILWFRYHVVNTKKFSFRAGAHPAVNWMPKQIKENGSVSEMVKLRRFLAWELAPNFKINDHLNIGLYYLQGNGLQKDGPQTIHYVNFYTSVNNIKLSKGLRFFITPAVFYLYQDGNEGTYFTAVAGINHIKFPFSITSAINKTIKTDIPGSKDFIWNVSLNYNFGGKIH